MKTINSGSMCFSDRYITKRLLEQLVLGSQQCGKETQGVVVMNVLWPETGRKAIKFC